MDFLIFFTLGTFVGSFFNVVIYRMPRDESIIKPRSHCPACKTSIPFYRNIPLVSFILQVGKCANCQSAISLQYPAVELINGLIWGWSFYMLPFPEAVNASFLSSILIAIAWIDARIYMVPLDLIVAGVIVLLFAVIFGVLSYSQVLWGIAAGVLLPGFMMGLTWLVTRRQGMGFGDLQLGLILGAWVGPVAMILTLFFASFLGLVAWIVISMVKGLDRDRPLPFAPYLVFSAISIFIVSEYSTTLIDQLIMV